MIKDFPRDKIKITSKWGAKFGAQGIIKDMSMATCREQCEGSLQRLGVDYLDMFIYRGPPKDDHGTTIEQCVENMKVLPLFLFCNVLCVAPCLTFLQCLTRLHWPLGVWKPSRTL